MQYVANFGKLSERVINVWNQLPDSAMTLNEGFDPEVLFSPTQEVDKVDDSEASYLHNRLPELVLEQTYHQCHLT